MSTTLLENKVVTRSKQGIATYDLDEYCRWLCLLEAIEHIDYKAKELDFDLDTDKTWVQPLALQKYIRERFLSMKFDVVSQLGGDVSGITLPVK